MSDGISAAGTQTPALVSVSPNSSGFVRLAWDHWKKIGRAVGVVQTRILMVCFYFVFVLPIGLLIRLRGDPLHLKPPAGTNWTPHRHEEPSVDSARRQF